MSPETKAKPRSVALRKSIQELAESTFIKEEGAEPGYFLTKEQEKIYRTQIIAIIVNKEVQGPITTFLIDDGTATINAKIFEEKKEIRALQVGNAVLLVAKPRVFSQVKYLAPEIIRSIDPLWLKVNSFYYNKNNHLKTNKVIGQEKTGLPGVEEKKAYYEQKESEVVTADILNQEQPKFPFEKLMDLIKKLDSGGGVAIEDILEKSPLAETEKLIEKMLENGDVFQNMPGRVKVL